MLNFRAAGSSVARRLALGAALGLGAAGLGLPAFAQDAFPNKALRLMVPAPPGGGLDAYSRLITKRLSDDLGQPVVIENRAGAGGFVGAVAVSKAKPDGYLLVVWNDGLLINPALMATAPYDPQSDFTPISLALYVPNLLVAWPGAGIKTFGELVAKAKADPGGLAYGSPGQGTPATITTEYLAQLAGIRLRHVPYGGGGPAVVAAAAGHVPLAMIAAPNAMELIRSGRLTAVAVVSGKRLGALPNVPTVAEAGVTGFNAETFFAVLGPAGIPAPIVKRLENSFRVATLEEATARQLSDQGFQPVGGSSAQLAELIARDAATWRDIVKKTGAKGG